MPDLSTSELELLVEMAMNAGAQWQRSKAKNTEQWTMKRVALVRQAQEIAQQHDGVEQAVDEIAHWQ